MMLSRKEINYLQDPLIDHTYSRKEFVQVLSERIRESEIGGIVQVIVSGKLRLLRKISLSEVKEVYD